MTKASSSLAKATQQFWDISCCWEGKESVREYTTEQALTQLRHIEYSFGPHRKLRSRVSRVRMEIIVGNDNDNVEQAEQ